MPDRPPRVAFLLPGLGSVERGAERALIEVASGLQERHGWAVELFGRGPDFPSHLTGHAVPCINRRRFEAFPKVPALRSEYAYEELTFAVSLKASRLFDPSRFDVAVHCSYPFINWMLSRIPERRRPLRLFVTQNGDWMCRRINSEYRAFRCDGLVAINPEYHERHRETYPTVLIPNGVHPERFAFEPRGGGEPSRKRRVLMVSALIESKRVEAGIRALARIPDADLTIIGDGPLREELSQLAHELMPYRSRLVRSVSHDEMAAHYAAADCFLHTSQVEPFGIVYLEAAAAGCPVVAHNGPTQRWILGDAAVLADTDDVDALSDAVRSALRPGTASKLSLAARDRVEDRFAWPDLVDRYAAFIEERLAARRGDALANSLSSSRGHRRDLETP